jgi:hypothetical protein
MSVNWRKTGSWCGGPAAPPFPTQTEGSAIFRMLGVSVLVLSAVGSATAQEYTKKIVARNLPQLTGVTVSPFGQVYFTSTPTPGVGGERSRNTVNAVNPLTGRVRTLVTGEAEPTALATTALGDLYWVDRTAGAIRALEDGRPRTVAARLDVPTGVAAYPFGLALFVTEVPTPGQNPYNGGRNLVSAFLLGLNLKVTVDDFDTQPTDVAVDLDGTVYWTSTDLGLLLKRGTRGGAEIVARNLKAPTGLATDYQGNLYFTEVPNPGNANPEGPKNRVSRLEVRTGKVTVISEGDANPVDVGVSVFGRVYWADKTDGHIVEAIPTQR